MSNLFKIWTVHQNNDDRYIGPATAWCSTEAIAKEVAYKSGWWGGDAPIKEATAVTIRGKTYVLATEHAVILDAKHNAKLKQKMEDDARELALSKLSTEEKRLLGLK